MLQYGYRPQFPATRRTRTSDDQTWVDYLPMPERPRIMWPDKARIAVWMCPNVLFYELNSRPDPWINAWSRMTPDVMMYGRQEFGPRVGFWRMLDVLDKHGIPCTAVLNVAALRRYPDICKALVERRWDLLGHGMTNTQFICGHSEDEERAHYLDMLAIGPQIEGPHSPDERVSMPTVQRFWTLLIGIVDDYSKIGS